MSLSITTKTGDEGLTDWRSTRVKKTSSCIEFVGTLDELDAHLGAIIADLDGSEKFLEQQVSQSITGVKYHIGEIYKVAAVKGRLRVEGLENIDTIIDNLSNHYGKNLTLKLNISLGVTKTSSKANIARTVARRAERSFMRYMDDRGYEITYNSSDVLKFLNRLSDLLFLVVVILDETQY